MFLLQLSSLLYRVWTKESLQVNQCRATAEEESGRQEVLLWGDWVTRIPVIICFPDRWHGDEWGTELIELSEDQRERITSIPKSCWGEKKEARWTNGGERVWTRSPLLSVGTSDGSETNVASIDDFLQFNFLILSFEMRTYNQLLFKLQRFIISIVVSAWKNVKNIRRVVPPPV